MIFENIKIAFGGLVSNKLRTVLSILGILIGVMSVTLLLAVGAGASQLVNKQVADLGGGVVYAFNKSSASDLPQSRKPAMTQADVAALLTSRKAPAVQNVSPALYMNGTVATLGKRTVNPAFTIGTNPAYFKVFTRRTTSGLQLSDADVKARRRVIVVGQTVVKKLFPGTNPIGKSIRVGTTDFQIIGVLEKRGGGIQGDLDSIILMPFTSMGDTLRGPFSSWDDLTIQPKFGTPNGVLLQQVNAVLSETHRITEKSKYDWETFDNSQLAETTNTISLAFRGLLGLIAGISLLVGGIGVMNIMLVTVTERTREIGIRKALGARRSHLLSQFLVEAVVLTGVGGILGVGIGAALSQIKVGPASAILAPWMAGLAFGVSVFIGVVFGVYPANRAAKLKPIDALRYE
jgi:putative ABC transport system permease protein